MYAVLVHVDANESHIPQAREVLPNTAVPGAKQSGGKSGCWIAPGKNGGGLSIVVYETEAQAQEAASQLPLGPTNVVEGVNFTAVEVREVLASF